MKKKLVTILTLGVITMSNLVSYAANTKVIGNGVKTVYEMNECSPLGAAEVIEADSDPDVKDAKSDNSESDAAEEAKVEKAHEDNVKHSESKLGTSLGMFKLTAYCPCKKCNGNNPPVTRMGTPLVPGQTIAVDKRVIPLGTWIYLNLPGKGWTKFRAEDTGSSIKGKRIDVLLPKHSECYSATYNSTVEVRLALA